MTQVKTGDTVKMHYTGTLTDGSIFDSSVGREPMEITVGAGHIIPGLDVALPGMALGEKKNVTVPADQAYGQPHAEARQTVPRSEIPADIPLEEGLQLQMQTQDGRAIPIVVAELTETEVTLDANHPLAGKDLNFVVEIVEINS